MTGRRDLEDGKTGRQDSFAAPSAAFPLLCRRHCSPLLAPIVVVACNKGDSRRKGIAGVKVAEGVDNCGRRRELKKVGEGLEGIGREE